MEQEKFEELYKDFYKDLVKVAMNMLGSLEIAEEMTQEAFIRLYNRELDFPEPVQARYWLIRVVKNLCLNHLKRRKLEQKHLKKQKRETTFYKETGETKALLNESRSIVEESLLSLPKNLKEPLVLREYGNLSYKEIAKALNISESNVKVRIFRARQFLAKKINKEDVYVSK